MQPAASSSWWEWAGYKWATALALGWWAGLHPSWQFLLVFQALDIVTGLLVAGMNGREKISSEASYAGMKKKALVWILVGTAGLLSSAAKLLPNVPFDVPGQAIVATFYCVTEAISIVENIRDSGVDLPPFLAALLDKLRSVKTPTKREYE